MSILRDKNSESAPQRLSMLNDLVEEITKDIYDIEKVKQMTSQLSIAYSDDPILLLNNILKGIHSEPPQTSARDGDANV
jgi:hypothetical protein